MCCAGVDDASLFRTAGQMDDRRCLKACSPRGRCCQYTIVAAAVVVLCLKLFHGAAAVDSSVAGELPHGHGPRLSRRTLNTGTASAAAPCKAPYVEVSYPPTSAHGDVCRRTEESGPETRTSPLIVCPTHCTRVGGAPYCATVPWRTMSATTHEACRISAAPAPPSTPAAPPPARPAAAATTATAAQAAPQSQPAPGIPSSASPASPAPRVISRRCRTCRAGGAADGGIELDDAGVCLGWCSKGGSCGTGPFYKVDSTDCRGTAAIAKATVHTAAAKPLAKPVPPPQPGWWSRHFSGAKAAAKATTAAEANPAPLRGGLFQGMKQLPKVSKETLVSVSALAALTELVQDLEAAQQGGSMHAIETQQWRGLLEHVSALETNCATAHPATESTRSLCFPAHEMLRRADVLAHPTSTALVLRSVDAGEIVEVSARPVLHSTGEEGEEGEGTAVAVVTHSQGNAMGGSADQPYDSKEYLRLRSGEGYVATNATVRLADSLEGRGMSATARAALETVCLRPHSGNGGPPEGLAVGCGRCCRLRAARAGARVARLRARLEAADQSSEEFQVSVVGNSVARGHDGKSGPTLFLVEALRNAYVVLGRDERHGLIHVNLKSVSVTVTVSVWVWRVVTWVRSCGSKL